MIAIFYAGSLKLGSFNGKYKLTLIDNGGKVYSIKEVALDNVKTFRFNFDQLGSGKYMIIIKNNDGSESAVVEFQNL